MFRVLVLLVELFLITVAAFAADVLSFEPIPEWLVRLPAVSYPPQDFWTVLWYFLAVHAVVLVLAQVLLGPWRPADARRTADEMFALGATFAMAALLIFLTTTVAFDPQFIAGIPLYTAFLLLVLHFGAVLREQSFGRAVGALLRATFRRTLSIPGVLVLVFAVSPAVLAKLFTSDRDFANVITQTRIRFADRGVYAWGFADALAGRRFHQPMVVQFPPGRDDEVWLLERSGRLVRVAWGEPGDVEVMLDISGQVGHVEVENGALGFDFHPDFGREDSAQRSAVYLYYTAVRDDRQANRLSRFDLGGATLAERAASEDVLILWQRNNSGFHNGGSVEFGPDGFLYVSVGDMLDPDTPQNVTATLASGVLRIDVDRKGHGVSHPIPRRPGSGATRGYFVPDDNPFVGRADTLEEYWAVGLRNPFRISFDPETGALWAGDVGSAEWEEVNLLLAGRNYQYPFIEGREETGRPRPGESIGTEAGPIFTYGHTAYDRAVVGGIVYRGTRHPGLRGQYLFADNYSGKVFSIPATGEPVDSVELLAQADEVAQRGITSLIPSPEGEVLITTLGKASEATGRLLRLVPRDEAEVAAIATRELLSPAAAAELFRANCGRCHGVEGGGHGPEARDMDVALPDFRDSAFHEKRDDRRLRSVIAEGGAAHGLSPMMPPWRQILSDPEVDALVDHIRRLAATPGKA